jgi:ribonuclease BN (tRNA processing enzyme)
LRSRKKTKVSQPNKSQNKSDLIVKYIANEDVLISSGNEMVLIDGFHREYEPDYLFPPKDLLESLENAKNPYNKINLLLVSHLHLDHFHPLSIGLH